MTAASLIIGVVSGAVGVYLADNIGIALGLANIGLAFIGFVNKGQADD